MFQLSNEYYLIYCIESRPVSTNYSIPSILVSIFVKTLIQFDYKPIILFKYSINFIHFNTIEKNNINQCLQT
jgi:hypothetical protein